MPPLAQFLRDLQVLVLSLLLFSSRQSFSLPSRICVLRGEASLFLGGLCVLGGKAVRIYFHGFIGVYWWLLNL